MLNRSQQGSVQVIFLVLILVGVTGVGAYYLGIQNSKSTQSLISNTSPVIPQNNATVAPTVTPSPKSNETENSQSFSSKSCKIAFKVPMGWKVSEVTNEESERYNEGCMYINAPDFKIVGMDSDEGLSIGVLRTKIGTDFHGVTVDSLVNYISATETIVNPKRSATSVKEKTIGNFSGKYFEYEAYRNMANFVFQHDNYIYTITWRADYQGAYINRIDEIVSSMTF